MPGCLSKLSIMSLTLKASMQNATAAIACIDTIACYTTPRFDPDIQSHRGLLLRPQMDISSSSDDDAVDPVNMGVTEASLVHTCRWHSSSP